MRNQFLSISMLFVVIFLAACSKKDPPPSDTNIMPVKSLADAQQLASQAVAHCTYPDQCSPSVGMLIGTTSDFAFQCTAFLVAKDIVATNSHCVPDDLKVAGTSCANRIALVFPDTEDFVGIKPGCAQVISASDIDSNLSGPDFAFLKLDTSVPRPSLAITRSGLNDNTIYSVFKMDPYQGNGVPEAYLHKAECKSVYGSLIAGGNASAQSDVQALADCSVIHGNSGSPVVDSSGNVPAIVFATIDHDKATGLIGEFANQGIDFIDSEIAELGIATNYSCQTLPIETGPVPEACARNANSRIYTSDAVLKNAISSNLNESMLATLQASASKLDPSISWKSTLVDGKGINPYGAIYSDKASKLAVSVPNCVLDENKFLGSEQRNWGGEYPGSSSRRLTMLIWTVKSGLNRYLQVDSSLVEAQTFLEQSMLLLYNPQILATKNISILEVSSSLSDNPNESLYSADLSSCAAQN